MSFFRVLSREIGGGGVRPRRAVSSRLRQLESVLVLAVSTCAGARLYFAESSRSTAESPKAITFDFSFFFGHGFVR